MLIVQLFAFCMFTRVCLFTLEHVVVFWSRSRILGIQVGVEEEQIKAEKAMNDAEKAGWTGTGRWHVLSH